MFVALVVVLGCGDDDHSEKAVSGELDASVLDAAAQQGNSSNDAARIGPDGAQLPVDAPPGSACAPTAVRIPTTNTPYHREGTIDYPDPPPVGGDHNPCWGEWKVYDASAPLAVEHWVHNLEHGGIVYLYNCPDGCDAEVSELATFVKAHPQTLLTPYAAMPMRFAAISWGVRMTSECFNGEAFENFYTRFVGKGLEVITDGPPDSCL